MPLNKETKPNKGSDCHGFLYIYCNVFKIKLIKFLLKWFAINNWLIRLWIDDMVFKRMFYFISSMLDCFCKSCFANSIYNISLMYSLYYVKIGEFWYIL